MSEEKHNVDVEISMKGDQLAIMLSSPDPAAILAAFTDEARGELSRGVAEQIAQMSGEL